MANIDSLLSEVTSELSAQVKAENDATIKEFKKYMDEKVEAVDTMFRVGAKLTVKTDTKVSEVIGLKHSKLEQLIKIANQRLPILLVGMAGTGKTYSAEQVATALGLEFSSISVGAQTSKSDILGFIHAGGNTIITEFRKRYENGGVFLMDELDAGNANVLIILNSALSNGYCAFPDKMVKKHKDFVFIASANTYGQGANRQYVGRNQLDASTLDRFVIVNYDIDPKLEKLLAGKGVDNLKWYKTILAIRKFTERENLRVLISPRATIKGAQLLNAGLDFETVLRCTVLGGVPVDMQNSIIDVANSAWDK